MAIENGETKKTVQQLAIDLGVLQNEVKQVAAVNEKLDTAIDRLTDISSSIKSMLAVHEEKLNKQEDIDKAIFKLLENRRIETEQNIKVLESQLNDIHRELKEDLELTEKRLMCEIKSISNSLNNRVGVLEKYRWIIIGVSIALGLSFPEVFKYLTFVQ